MLALAIVLAAAPAATGCYGANTCTARCDKGDARACFTLGIMKWGGVEAHRDLPAAHALLDKACTGGHWQACWELSPMLRQQPERSAELANKAKALAPAACFSQTLKACSHIERPKALPNFEKRCAAKDALACEEVASHHFEFAQPEDPKKAAVLRQKACELGALTACYDLGNNLMYGHNLEKDVARGEKLILKACDEGYAASCQRLAATLVNAGSPLPRSSTRAAALEKKACALGHGLGCPRPQPAPVTGK